MVQPGYEDFWKNMIDEEYERVEIIQIGEPDPVAYYNPLTREVHAVSTPSVYEVVLPDGMIVGVY